MYGDIHHVGVWISQADILPCISPASPLYLVWISQAEARQRAGRAGRVRAGHNFKLYTSWRHTQLMQAARTPEMLRGPLQEVCLQLRLAPMLAEMSLRTAFERALDTPPEATITAAVTGLQRTGALDEEEQLTPLGRHLAALPCAAPY